MTCAIEGIIILSYENHTKYIIMLCGKNTFLTSDVCVLPFIKELKMIMYFSGDWLAQ